MAKTRIKFMGIGWKSRIAMKRATYTISINKLVAEGNLLEKGKELNCYLGEDGSDRKVILVYLDGGKEDG